MCACGFGGMRPEYLNCSKYQVLKTNKQKKSKTCNFLLEAAHRSAQRQRSPLCSEMKGGQYSETQKGNKVHRARKEDETLRITDVFNVETLVRKVLSIWMVAHAKIE